SGLPSNDAVTANRRGRDTQMAFCAPVVTTTSSFVGCFAFDYDSQHPAHPGRAFRGRDQVRSTWTSLFSGVPDFTAELISSAVTAEGVEVGEWFGMRGVIVAGIRDDQIAWGRLYIEPIEAGGQS